MSTSIRAGVRGCAVQVRVLAGVSLVVGAGEIVGIGGGAGSGKSTLLRCAAGIVRPEQGSVYWPAARGVFGRADTRGSVSIIGSSGEAAGWPFYADLRDLEQQCGLERALAAGVPLLLVDHVTPSLIGELRTAIASAPQGRRSAIIVAGRSGAELGRLASRVLVLRGGQLHEWARGVIGSTGPDRAQRNRSAARASSEFPAAVARARMRST